jgi:hypothetical protein
MLPDGVMIMSSAPDVMTSAYQQPSTTDPHTDAVAATLRSKTVVQEIPVYQPAFQFSVPSNVYNRGWIASDVPTVPGPTYPYPVQAPPIQYKAKSYSTLIQKAANPSLIVNREPIQLSAPSIQTTY